MHWGFYASLFVATAAVATPGAQIQLGTESPANSAVGMPLGIQGWPESARAARWLLRRSPNPEAERSWLNETNGRLRSDRTGQFIVEPVEQEEFDGELSFAIRRRILATATLSEVERKAFFHGRDPEEVADFLREIQRCFRENDRRGFAKHIYYPSGGSLGVVSEDDFLGAAEKWWTPALAETVAQTSLENIFSNYTGIMIGNGEIWIEGTREPGYAGCFRLRIFALNEVEPLKAPEQK